MKSLHVSAGAKLHPFVFASFLLLTAAVASGCTAGERDDELEASGAAATATLSVQCTQAVDRSGGPEVKLIVDGDELFVQQWRSETSFTEVSYFLEPIALPADPPEKPHFSCSEGNDAITVWGFVARTGNAYYRLTLKTGDELLARTTIVGDIGYCRGPARPSTAAARKYIGFRGHAEPRRGRFVLATAHTTATPGRMIVVRRGGGESRIWTWSSGNFFDRAPLTLEFDGIASEFVLVVRVDDAEALRELAVSFAGLDDSCETSPPR